MGFSPGLYPAFRDKNWGNAFIILGIPLTSRHSISALLSPHRFAAKFMIKTTPLLNALKKGVPGLCLILGGLSLTAQEAPEMEMAMPNLNTAPESPTTVSPEVRLQQIRTEFLQIDKKLQLLQQNALQDPTVQKREAAYLKALKKEMLAIAGKKMDAQVKKRFQLSKRLDEAATPETSMSQQQLMALSQKFDKALEAVSEIEDQAASKPEVKEKEDAFVNLVTQKMREANPNLGNLIQRQQELAQEFQIIQNQLGS